MDRAKCALIFCIIVFILGYWIYNERQSPPLQEELSEVSGIRFYSYNIVNTYPHDPAAFTQGLVFEDNHLYEGTGLRGQSSLRKVELETGNIINMYELPQKYFGEGITLYKDRIIQLTWQSYTGFVYDKDTFTVLEEFSYSTEGWGITHDGNTLIMSDGTSTLYFLDFETFEVVRTLEVYDDTPVTRLNELEYINGEIYANVWLTDSIAIISPDTGKVRGWIELEGLLPDTGQQPDVLNGIAYDADNDRLFVTGKLWPYLFEIDLVLLRVEPEPSELHYQLINRCAFLKSVLTVTTIVVSQYLQ
jgi:glutamine cyclotransferase